MTSLTGVTFESLFTGGSNQQRIPPMLPVKTSPRSKSDLSAFLKKTPLSIFEEGLKGTYQENAQWITDDISNDATGPEFRMTVQIRGIKVTGQANSKKAAKQKAAVAYLHEAVKKGNKDAFFIPGATEEEAHANIDQMAEKMDDTKRSVVKMDLEEAEGLDRSIPTIGKIPDGVNDANFVGKLGERAQKMKLEMPLYSEQQLANGKFAITCTMCKQKTCGVGSTKKTAKNFASYLMLELLEKGESAIQGDIFGTEFDEIEADDRLIAVQEAAFAEIDKKGALEKILSDSRRFGDFKLDFHYQSVNSLGTHQVLLQVTTTRPPTPEADDLEVGAEHTQTAALQKAHDERRKNLPEPGKKVFSGHGRSEEEAQNSAYQSAIIHYNTYPTI